MMRDERHAASDKTRSFGSKPRRVHVPVWAIVLAAAAALVALGLAQGDAVDVWRKASLICYECIGIG